MKTIMKIPAICFFTLSLSLLAFAGAASAETTNSDLSADLIKASFFGNLSEVERLLAKGASVNAKRDDGITALIGASIEGHQEIVELLLSKGAEVDAKAYYFGHSGGATAYDLASQKGHQEIVKLLVRAGAFHVEKIEIYREKKAPSPEESYRPSRKTRD